jgi:4a-hydroxytetrahydrobiopterin dehydratase
MRCVRRHLGQHESTVVAGAVDQRAATLPPYAWWRIGGDTGFGRADSQPIVPGLGSLRSVGEVGVSTQGWQEFLAAEDVEDWVVLHGGATAVFRAGSLGDAVELARAVAQVPGLERSGVVLTVADQQLTVRLSRHFSLLERQHLELARAITAVTKAHGAVPDRAAAQEVSLAIAAKPDAVDGGFWRAVLGYTGATDVSAVDPLGHGSSVWMQELDAAKPLRHAMHVDVAVAREHVEARLRAALDAGGRIVDDSEAPEQWTLADRAGNRVCICAWPDGATLPADSGQGP